MLGAALWVIVETAASWVRARRLPPLDWSDGALDDDQRLPLP